MRVSINATNFSYDRRESIGRELARMVRSADDSGIDTVWVSDHLIQADPTANVEEPMLEAYTTLGYLAAVSTRVRLGTMVSAATFRPTTLLIKAVTSLDVLSGGRAWLGIGAGHEEREARWMGLPFPSMHERFDLLEETLQLAVRMWADDTSPFQGKDRLIEKPLGRPLPLSQPRPPILIGGMGPRRTLPLVARYADACNLFDIPDGGTIVSRTLHTLAELCAAIGRPFEQVEKTISVRLEPDSTPEEFADHCASLCDLGLEHAVVITPGPWTEGRINTLAEAISILA